MVIRKKKTSFWARSWVRYSAILALVLLALVIVMGLTPPTIGNLAGPGYTQGLSR